MRKKKKMMVRKKKKKTMMRNKKKKKRKAQSALFTLTVLIHVSLALVFYNKPLHTLTARRADKCLPYYRSFVITSVCCMKNKGFH